MLAPALTTRPNPALAHWQASRDLLAASVASEVLAAVAPALQQALAPLRASLPALARELLLDGTWDAARLAARLYPPQALAAAARQVQTALATGLAALGALGAAPALPLPPAPRELAGRIMAAVAAHRATLCLAAQGQNLADRYWRRALGALWPKRIPRRVWELWAPELERLTWSRLALAPLGLTAGDALADAAAQVERQLHGALDAWAHRVRAAWEEAVVAAVYAAADGRLGTGTPHRAAPTPGTPG